MKKIFIWATLSIAIILLSFLYGCGQEEIESYRALKQIRAKDIKRHTQVLASDEFQGRKPGTHGDSLTTDYLLNYLKNLGIEPGVNKDSYLQQITMIARRYRASITLENDDDKINLEAPNHILVQKNDDGVDHQNGNALAVLSYNDKIDELSFRLKDKFVLFFANTFGSPLVDDLTEMNDQGAKAIFMVHENRLLEPNLPWQIFVGSLWNEVSLSGVPETSNIPLPIIWINNESAKKLSELIGHSYEGLVDHINNKSFEPFAVPLSVDCNYNKDQSEIISNNIVGKIESKNPDFKDEYIVYTAHWDHLGIDPSAGKDSIFNGALDNAGGVATLMSIIKAFKKTDLKRSLLIVFTTAEEMGLSGAKFFTQNPVVPLSSIIANINIDGVSMWSKTKDIIITGPGYTSIDRIASQVAETQNRYIVPDPHPEMNFYLHSDQYPFAQNGIPAFFASGGFDIEGKGKDFGERINDEYMANDYHKPSDEVKSSFDFEGAKLDADFFFLLGYQLSWDDNVPTWTDDCPFPQFKGKWLEMHKN